LDSSKKSNFELSVNNKMTKNKKGAHSASADPMTKSPPIWIRVNTLNR